MSRVFRIGFVHTTNGEQRVPQPVVCDLSHVDAVADSFYEKRLTAAQKTGNSSQWRTSPYYQNSVLQQLDANDCEAY
jgi:hypothetical protein